MCIFLAHFAAQERQFIYKAANFVIVVVVFCLFVCFYYLFIYFLDI